MVPCVREVRGPGNTFIILEMLAKTTRTADESLNVSFNEFICQLLNITLNLKLDIFHLANTYKLFLQCFRRC